MFKCLSLLGLFFLPLHGAENPFFAMNTIARGRPEQVVPLLKELGYDGLGGQAGDAAMATALKTADLRFFNGYLTLSLVAGKSPLDESLRSMIDRMDGHHTALWLALQAVEADGKRFPPSAPQADAIVLAALKEISTYSKSRHVSVVLYPHAGFWMERFDDSIRLADQLDDDNIGTTFNLCHWLKVEGSDRDPAEILKSAIPRLRFVTINGADAGNTKSMGWDRLIQPLGEGTYDVPSFLRKLREAGYRGPVGLQGYGITRDPREVLQQSMAQWRKMKQAG